LVSIDVDALKDEMSGLQEFLEKKLGVKVMAEGKVMNVGSEGEISRRKVKDYVERFFYRKGLSDTYAVNSQKDGIKIIKKKT
jgi:ABC-type proline/glycine betaine transport system ATPase subunit